MEEDRQKQRCWNICCFKKSQVSKKKKKIGEKGRDNQKKSVIKYNKSVTAALRKQKKR